MKHRPLLLVILDGFGIRQNSDPDADSDAIKNAKTPTWDKLWSTYPHTTLSASGLDVGLPDGQMGNSEVGHLTIGAGRVIEQDLTRINHEIKNGQIYKNDILLKTFETAHHSKCRVHLLGLLSPGGVHSHEDHIFTLLDMAVQKGVSHIFVHAFLDGRDTPPKSAEASLQKLKKICEEKNNSSHQKKVFVGSLCGRYYAMDRDKRFDRTQRAYELLTDPDFKNPTEETSIDPIQALLAAYQRGESDEFIQPIRLVKNAIIQDNDIVIFMNFRNDRTRQLSYAFLDPHFMGFIRKEKPKLTAFLTLTEYAADLKSTIIFPHKKPTNVLGEILAQHHLKQLRIAETEKYAHVTFFINGGQETKYDGEDRILIPSPKVSTYDQKPEMSAEEITHHLVQAIQKQTYDVIICNYANPDMVGHTGNFAACVTAIQVIDHCLADLLDVIQKVGGEMIITADHGNAECMKDPVTHTPHTAHTSEPVPFVYVGREAQIVATSGSLSDIAPTLLMLLGLPIPKEMTGKPIIKRGQG